MTAGNADQEPSSDQVSDRVILPIASAYAAAFIVFGFVVDTPGNILGGLIEITTTRDAPLTGNFGAGGTGVACLNAGVLTQAASFIKRSSKCSGSWRVA